MSANRGRMRRSCFHISFLSRPERTEVLSSFGWRVYAVVGFSSASSTQEVSTSISRGLGSISEAILERVTELLQQAHKPRSNLTLANGHLIWRSFVKALEPSPLALSPFQIWTPSASQRHCESPWSPHLSTIRGSSAIFAFGLPSQHWFGGTPQWHAGP